METTKISDRFKLMAGIVEKFVENNLMEKDQRDENLRKLAMAFESFVKDSRIASTAEKFKAKAEEILYADMGARSGVESIVTKDISVFGSHLQTVPVKVKKLANFKGELPKYQTSLAAGLDVRAQLNEPLEIKPGQRVLVPTGLAVAIPAGFEIQARPRSGWAIRDGMTLLNTPGTIDADYRGEIKIILVNLGENAVTINDQDRIAQLVLCPVLQLQWEEVENLDNTDRGAGGFGSTGK